jgi:Type IV secretion-system coupling protein DNA-binding domain
MSDTHEPTVITPFPAQVPTIMGPENASPRAVYEHSERRDFVGLNIPGGAKVETLMASTALLESLVNALEPGERLIAHIDFATPKAMGLSVEVVAVATSKKDAGERAEMLALLFDAALETGLPSIDIAPAKERKYTPALTAKRHLAPAGFSLPLGLTSDMPKPRIQRARDARSGDAVVFSPGATGAHLASFGAAVGAIKVPLMIEVRMARTPFDGKLKREIASVRTRIGERQQMDANRFVRDSRYAEADKRLESLQIAGAGISFDVIVHSERKLYEPEVSALAAALFGASQDDNQHGLLSNLRSLYPQDEAVTSFFGIVAAAILPTLERQKLAELDQLEGNIIGKTKGGQLVRMPVTDPRSHTYIIGRPGCGKSTLMLNLMHQDIMNGEAVVLIDPHGDLWKEVRDCVPAHRREDLLVYHMGDLKQQPRMNVLELGPGDPAAERALVVDTMYQLVRRLMFSGLSMDSTGPMFNKYFRAALMLLLEAEGPNAKLEQFETIFADSDYRDELRRRPSVSAQTREQWEQILAVNGNDHSIESVTPWITSKVSQLTQSGILKPILGASTTSFTFDEVLKNKKILLINLANGQIGAEAAGLLGGVLTHRLEQAAKRQSTIDFKDRHKASIYFDEFHTFASEFIRPLMAETRKYGLRVTLANQTLSQMINNDISGGVFREVLGNCANTICFAVDSTDAAHLAPRFGGRFDPGTLVAQANYQAICQFQSKSAALGPFVVKTLPPPEVEEVPF